MGKVRQVLGSRGFLDAGPLIRRAVLEQLGVPTQPGEDMTTLLTRAEAMARQEDAQEGETTISSLPEPRSGPPGLGTLMQGAGAVGLQLGKQAALPTLGSVGGGMVAPLLGVPSQIGQAVGSMAGEGLNQLAGITPQSMQQLLMSGVVPAAARGVGQAMPMTATVPQDRMIGLVQRLPGGAGALAEQASEEIRGLPGQLRQVTERQLGSDTVDSLFTQAYAANPQIPLTTVRQVMPQLQAQLDPTLTSARRLAHLGNYESLIQEMQDLAQQTAPATKAVTRGVLQLPGGGTQPIQTSMGVPAQTGAVPLITLDRNRRLIGAALEHPETLNSEQATILKRTYAALMTDMETAAKAGVPGADDLLRGVTAAKRQFAADNLEEMIDHVGFGVPRPDGIPDPRTGRMVLEMRRAARDDPSRYLERFKESVTPQEFSEIQDLLEFWNDRKVALAPPAGVQFGSGPTAAAAGLAYGVTGSGQAAGLLLGARALLSRVLMSGSGREALRDLIARDQPINLTELIALGMGQMGREALGPDPVGTSRQLLGGMRAPGETRLEAPPPLLGGAP